LNPILGSINVYKFGLSFPSGGEGGAGFVDVKHGMFRFFPMWKYIGCSPTMITARGTMESREEMIQHSMAHTLQENSTCKQDNNY
jgi:hypothetical protein